METNLGPSEVQLIQAWNKFLTSVVELEKQWNSLIELRTAPGFNIERLPPKAGKFFGLATARSSFLVALPRLLDYVRKYSSMSDMIVELPKLEEKKEVSNARPRR